MSITTPASKYLTTINIPHTEFIHQGKVSSIEEAAEQRNQNVNQIIRSIVFRLGKDNYIMILVAGKVQIDWKKLRKFFNISRLTTASPEEVVETTGFVVGSVGPFGLKKQIKIYLDENILNIDSVSIGSGVRGTGIIITSKNLIEALGDNAQIGNFAK